ncbi:MAG: A/G-specific adenine glycosylase [Saprospiraceae bacterium]
MIPTATKSIFQTRLLEWAKSNPRPMPWKAERNPYFIWLSEIILQQTRVAQGTSYYEKIISIYPDVFALAGTSEDELMKVWEGLGYYSRARNLHHTAKCIANEMNGVFPDTYDEILKLKGIGEYTAAAIASFAFDLPHAVVDGNVFRVLSRFFGIELPIDSNEGKKYFSRLANELLIKNKSAIYNQAIMDFGAIQCTPKSPDCDSCTLSENCQAKLKDQVKTLPLKDKKIKKSNRYFNYMLFIGDGFIWVGRREQKDIWQQLYEFPMLETKEPSTDINGLIRDFLAQNDIYQSLDSLPIISSGTYIQQLTHQKISAVFHEIQLNNDTLTFLQHWKKIMLRELKIFAFPRIIDLYLKEKNYL